MPEIYQLETELGFQIEKIKNFTLTTNLIYSILDQLDRKLYELFLKIKSKFNKYSPISKDKKVMLLITQTIKTLVSKFKSENNLIGNEDIDNA